MSKNIALLNLFAKFDRERPKLIPRGILMIGPIILSFGIKSSFLKNFFGGV